jgi:hypothetical protein
MNFAHATHFDGDPAQCVAWLGYARGVMRQILSGVPSVPSKVVRPADGVEITIRINPNQIFIKAGSGKAYITYVDWKGDTLNSGSSVSEWGRLDRFIHRETKLITVEPAPIDPPLRPLPLPRFNPTVKQGFYAASDAYALQPNAGSGNYEVFLTQYARGNYWLSKTNNCINWDADNVYIDGNRFTLSEPSYNPFNRQYVLVCCCFAGTITASDLTAWGDQPDAVELGKKKVIVIRYHVSSRLFYISVYAYDKTTKTIYTPRIYQREIPAEGYNDKSWMNYVFVGFKTDSKTLVMFRSTFSGLTAELLDGGVFAYTFNDTYTAQTITKLGNHNFAEITEVSSINESGTQDQDGFSVVKQVDGTLSKDGHHIMQIFHHKDYFTVIYEDWNEYNWHERYTYAINDGGKVTQTVDGNYQENRDFTVHKIDWTTNAVIPVNKTLLKHQDRYTYGSNDTDGAGTKFNIKQIIDIDTYILFASASLDLYIYRECPTSSVINQTSDGTTLTTTTSSNEKYRVVIEHKGVKTVVEEVEIDKPETTVETQGGIEAEPWANYYNGSAVFENETFYLDIMQLIAFDGTLAACCFDLYDSQINTVIDYRKNPRTLIFNTKTKERQLIDYRVDNEFSNNNRYYPLSVTNNIPKDTP